MTVFTIPKPFEKEQDIRIQKNAINSWLRYINDVEVILCGDDKGVGEYSDEVGCKHIENIEKNEYGTPLVSDAFKKASRMSKDDVLMYVNCDIIFYRGVNKVVRNVDEYTSGDYLIVGRRVDLDIDFDINFEKDGDLKKLTRQKSSNGSLHGYTGIDYFIYKKGGIPELPRFAVGRPGWDNWLIYTSKEENIPVFDATQDIEAIHQNHEEVYNYDSNEVKDNFSRNRKALDGGRKQADIRHADWLVKDGKIVSPPLWKRIYSYLTMSNVVGRALSIKRQVEWTFKK